MPNISCPNCGRQISDQSRRCLYCGRLLVAASDEEIQADLRQSQRMAAIYSAGIGLGGRTRRSWIDEMSDQPVAVRLLVATALLPLMMFAPFRVLRSIKAMFEP